MDKLKPSFILCFYLNVLIIFVIMETDGGMEKYRADFDKVLVFVAGNSVPVGYNPSPFNVTVVTKGLRGQGAKLGLTVQRIPIIEADGWCQVPTDLMQQLCTSTYRLPDLEFRWDFV